MRPDVIVVGGGVIGCAVAYFLLRERLSVRLIERESLGAQSSGAAAGMLAPLAETEGEGPLLRFGLESLAAFPQLAVELRERSGVDVEYEPCGILRVAEDEPRAAALEALGASLSRFDVEWIDAATVHVQEPQLHPEVCGALWSPREAHVQSPLLVRAYSRAAAALGAQVECGTAVVGLLRRGSRVLGVQTASGDETAGRVVLATGSWSGELGHWLDVPDVPPVTPVRGQILALEAPPGSIGSILWGSHAYLVPKRDGSVVVGATEERVGFAVRVTAAGLRSLLEAGPRLVPALADAPFRAAWAGLRPDTPDHLPILGAWPGLEGLFLATGHYRNGVLLSAGSGRLIADWVQGKQLPDYADAFRPERFVAHAAGAKRSKPEPS